MDFMNKLMPQSKEAEQYLLGCVLRDRDVRDDFFAKLKKEDFYLYPHQIAYDGIQKIYRRNMEVDMVTLFTEIQKANLVQDFGGALYMQEIWESAPTAANFDHFVSEVIGKSKLRMMIREMTHILSQAYDPNVDAESLLSASEAKIVEISNYNRGSVEFESLKNSAIARAIEYIEDVRSGKIPPGIESGFVDLDNAIGGFQPGELTILAARPGVGKTAFAMNLAMNIAKTQGNVFVVSGEQKTIEIATRVLANEGMTPLSFLRNPKKLYEGKVRNLREVERITQQYKYDIILDDRTMLTPDEILTSVRRAKRKYDVKMVIIDYLQRLTHTGSKQASKAELVGNTARMLKTISRICDVSILCLAQINRESEKLKTVSKSSKPSIHNLRDSGEIEQEADMVMLLNPDTEDTFPEGVQRVELIIAKQRSGPQGEINLRYLRPYIKFENWVPEQAINPPSKSSAIPDSQSYRGGYSQEDS